MLSQMGWLSNIFGVKPERRKAAQTGFYWRVDSIPPVAPGRGWNQDIHGESYYRNTLENLASGATKYGVLISKPAVLEAGEYEGHPAVFVYIDGERVGAIPSVGTLDLHREILAISSVRKVSAKAQISAGFEGGDYCVKLSLARPLKVRAL